MVLSVDRSRENERDIQDFGRVLAALLGDIRSDPREVASRYASSDLSRLRCPTPIPLRINNLIALQLLDGARVFKGGGGIVFQCVNQDIPQLQYALKVTRPSLFKGSLKRTGEELSRSAGEYLKHAPLSHQNVARVFGAGELKVQLATKGVSLPLQPVLMEWIEGAETLSDYLADSAKDWRAVVDVLAQVFDGLQHLHSQSLIHWDLKSDNVLVDHAGVPKIMDIGNARRSDVFSTEVAFSTRWNLPQELLRGQPPGPSHRASSSRRTPITVPGPEWDSPWLDMWMLGRELNRLFAAPKGNPDPDTQEAQAHPGKTTRERFQRRVFPVGDAEASYAFRYISLILRRLLSSSTPAGEYCYHDAGSVAADLRNLMPAFGAAQSIEELQAIPQKVLRLPYSGNAPYTRRFSKLYNSSLVRRTTRHLQLGTLVQVYPGGSHRRSEHTAGVVATTAQYVRALFANRREPFWRLAVSRRDIDALLLAALLHDVGHMSFGHALEEMEGLFSGRVHEDYALSVLGRGRETAEIRADKAELWRLAAEGWVEPGGDVNAFFELVAGILRPPGRPDVPLADGSDGSDNPAWAGWLKLRLLHSILDSAIDADKLDYLLRDAHHCGVQYAEGVDLDRFFQSLSPILVSRSQGSQVDACVGVSEKGILPVESLLIARYQMFVSVYWHHTARAHTAMLHYVVQQYIGNDKSLASKRVEELANAFRKKEDTDALKWLRNQVTGRNAPTILGEICDGLQGRRDRVYWPAFELRYERQKGPGQRIAKWLTECADTLNKAPDPADFVRGTDLLREEVSRELQLQLGRGFAFEPGDVLIDIPPPGKDQADNIWIQIDDPKRPIRPIQDLSPLADDVSNAFRLWARRLRIFLSPRAWARALQLGFSEEDVRDRLEKALLALERKQDPQETFAFDAIEK